MKNRALRFTQKYYSDIIGLLFRCSSGEILIAQVLQFS